MPERAECNAYTTLVRCEIDPPMLVYFSREITAKRETLRRLAHRVVDLAIDSGRHEWLRAEVDFGFAQIARDGVVKMVTDFVDEARAARMEVTRG